MPYTHYNRHYNDYRQKRLDAKPKRNLPSSVYEPITQTVVNFTWLQNSSTEKDQELNEFHYERARNAALTRTLEIEKDRYKKFVNSPVPITRPGKTKFSHDIYTKCTWDERRNYILETHNPGSICLDESITKEYEFMTKGNGHHYWLNSLVRAEMRENQESVLGVAGYYDEVIELRKQAVDNKRLDLGRAVKEIDNGLRREQGHGKYLYYCDRDITSQISKMRTINKEIKDMEKDHEYFCEAFVESFEDNDAIHKFTNSVDKIRKNNPYLEQRLAWERLIDEDRKMLNKIESGLTALRLEKESFITHEEFEKLQAERDIEFRRREERKQELQHAIEDRRHAIEDKDSLRAAQEKLDHILKTRKGHGHMTSSDKEKFMYHSEDEAFQAMVNQYAKHKRKLEPYSVEVSVRYTAWSPGRRHRVYQYLTYDGWFLRTFRA
jgi:ribosome-associated translation inhibitor RaiA